MFGSVISWPLAIFSRSPLSHRGKQSAFAKFAFASSGQFEMLAASKVVCPVFLSLLVAVLSARTGVSQHVEVSFPNKAESEIAYAEFVNGNSDVDIGSAGNAYATPNSERWAALEQELQILREKIVNLEQMKGDNPEVPNSALSDPFSGASALTAKSEHLVAKDNGSGTQPPLSSNPSASNPSSASKDIPSDKWKVTLGGHMQIDMIQWTHADENIVGASNYTNFRRMRLLADGVGYDQFDFRLQLTLEPDSETGSLFTTTGLVKDAYFTMNEIPGLGRFRIGHFFVPFSLEQVTNDTNNIFLERSVPSQTVFAADREIGAAVYNATDDKRVTWATGIFIDGVSESTKKKVDDNQGYRVSGRLTYLPFYDEESKGRRLVHTGIGVLHTQDADHQVRLRARPQINEGPRIIDSGVVMGDSYTTGNLESAIVWNQFAIQSEAFLSSISLLGGGEHTAHGAYTHFSWFLTGENRIFERFGQHGAQFGRNKPARNVKWKDGVVQPGAWEFKARWSYLNLDDFDRGRYNDLTVGFNWYWSDRTRMMMEWIHPYTTETAVFGQTESDLIGLRWDVNW